MEAIYHIPAMLKETIEGLAIKPGGVYVDVTFGGGGHSREILKNLTPTLPSREGKPHPTSPQGEEIKEGGMLYSFDQDREAYENAKGIQPPPNPPHKGRESVPKTEKYQRLQITRIGRLCIAISGI